jgi:hypothetical protein
MQSDQAIGPPVDLNNLKFRVIDEKAWSPLLGQKRTKKDRARGRDNLRAHPPILNALRTRAFQVRFD